MMTSLIIFFTFKEIELHDIALTILLRFPIKITVLLAWLKTFRTRLKTLWIDRSPHSVAFISIIIFQI